MHSAQDSHRDVMVSSTSKDLPDYRDKAKDAVWRAGLYPQMMEKDVAMNTGAVQYSLNLVDVSEAYIGIFAHRYGYIPDGSDISITEMEYRRAKERGIPILLFLIEEDYNIPVSEKTKDIYFERSRKNAAKLKKLKAELKRDYVVSFFTDPENLGAKIYQALTNLKDQGVFTQDEEEEEPPDLREGKLVEPPTPCIVHDYIQTRTFFGRKNELALIDDWACATEPMLIFEAIGGMGKSALTWHWLHQHAQKRISDLAGAIWWSFYESDGSMENFLKHALAYVTDTKPSDYNLTPPTERKRLLIDALKQKPYLLILDGIERILVAYHRMDAPMRSDHQVDEENRAAKSEADLRSCTDPRHGEVLLALASCAPSKILVSTRLIPHDLEDKQRRLLPGIAHQLLRGIYPQEALDLLHYLGVRGEAEAILRFTQQFDNHALILNVIAGLVVNYRPAPGNFDQWYADEGHALKLSKLDISQRRTDILQVALDGLEREQEQLLARLAAFRYPVEFAAVAAINPYLPPRLEPVGKPDTSYLDSLHSQLEYADSDDEKVDLQEQIAAEETYIAEQQKHYDTYQAERESWSKRDDVKAAQRQLNAALDVLEDRGLLQWDRLPNRYDLHPVVRAYVFERLNDDERGKTYTRIRNYFEALPPEDYDRVNEVDDLRRSLEIFNALTAQGLLEEASEFYKTTLDDPLGKLSAYRIILELMQAFFGNELKTAPRFQSVEVLDFLLDSVSEALSNVGKTQEALVFIEDRIKMNFDYINYGNLRNLFNSLNSYGFHLSRLNRLEAGDRAYDLAYSLSIAVDNPDWIVTARWSRFRNFVRRGEWNEVEVEYSFLQSLSPQDYTISKSFQVYILDWYSRMFIQRGEVDADLLDSIEKLASTSSNRAEQADTTFWRGEAALQLGDNQKALECFKSTLAIYRQLGDSAIHYLWKNCTNLCSS